jgi:hypothetical protein
VNGIGVINATGQPAIAGRFHTLVVQPTSFCGPGALNGNRLDRAGNPTESRSPCGMQTLTDAGLEYSVISSSRPRPSTTDRRG